MSERATGFVARLFGGRRRSAPVVAPAERLKHLAAQGLDDEAVSYRRQLYAQEPDLVLPVLVELRMGEVFLRFADPVFATRSFERALRFTSPDATQAVRLRLARLAQQIAHPVEPRLLDILLEDRTLGPDLRPKLERRLAFLRGDTAWDMPAIGHIPPAPWEEPPAPETTTGPRPQDLGAWHDQAAGRSTPAELSIAEALMASMDMDPDDAANAPGFPVDAPKGPAWGAASAAPAWSPMTPRDRTAPRATSRRRSRSVPLAAIPVIDDD